MTLRRPTGGASYTDVTVYGVLGGATPSDLPAGNLMGANQAGAMRQVDREARISNAEIAAVSWPGPPRSGDRIEADGAKYTVQSCDTRYIGAEAALHILRVRG